MSATSRAKPPTTNRARPSAPPKHTRSPVELGANLVCADRKRERQVQVVPSVTNTCIVTCTVEHTANNTGLGPRGKQDGGCRHRDSWQPHPAGIRAVAARRRVVQVYQLPPTSHQPNNAQVNKHERGQDSTAGAMHHIGEIKLNDEIVGHTAVRLLRVSLARLGDGQAAAS